MSREIAHYMLHLAENEDARAEHQSDPQAAMDQFGLNDEEKEIVASGDHEKIRDAVRQVEPDLADTMAIIIG
jgi:hypothetical protein